MAITSGVSAIVEPLLRSRHDVVGFVESAPHGGGPRGENRRGFRLARAVWRTIRPPLPSLAEVAAGREIPYFYLTRESERDLVGWLEKLRPSLVVVYLMSRLLRKSARAVPALGAINVHPSFLPEYRGPIPWLWTYYNQEAEGGVTVHFIDAGEDTGDIIFQQRFPITPGMPLSEMTRRTGEIGAGLVIRALDALADGNCPRVAQPADSPTERARLLESGEARRLIDWEEWPIERAWHLLHATEGRLGLIDPPPGWRRRFSWSIGGLTHEPSTAAAGTIGRDRAGFFVAHRQGRIRLSVDYDWKALIKGLLRGGR